MSDTEISVSDRCSVEKVMRANELIGLLKTAFTNKMKVLVVGAPGTGKSDIIDQAISAVGADSITRHASVEDPTDVKGLPAMVMGKAEFLPYGDLRKLIEADKPTICHLEDFGQAPTSVQAAYMQLLLRRSVNGHRLSDNIVFVASTNDTTDGAGVSGLIEPVKSRFDTIAWLECCLDDFINWAIGAGMPVWLIAYLRSRPDQLHQFKATKQITNSACPRTWAAVGKWSNIEVNNAEVWRGAVGPAAVEAYAYKEMVDKLPDPDAVLISPEAAPVPDQPSHKYAMATAIAYRATEKNFDRVLAYASRLGKAFEVLTVKDAFRRNNDIAKSMAWQKWVSDGTNRDICIR